MMKRILALDLSTDSTGWAFAEVGAEGDCYGLEFGKIHPKSTAPLTGKFLIIAEGIVEMLKCYKPTEVLIEELTHFRSASTVRALAGLQGVVRYAVYKESLIDCEMIGVTGARKKLGINQGRKATERGPAFKNLIKDRVVQNLKGRGIDVPGYDEADAVVLLLGKITPEQGA